jgi:hypothetical protein
LLSLPVTNAGLVGNRGVRREALIKDQSREHEDVGIVVLPGLGREAGLDTGLLDEGVAVPALLDRHLRQQQALDISLLNNQSVFTDLDLFDIQHTPQRR